MKKIFLFFILLGLAYTACAYAGNLYERFKDHATIRVLLRQVKDETRDKQAGTDEFKKAFTEVLGQRKNMSFTPVDKEADADVIVDADIKGYVFSEKVMPRFFSVYSLAADVSAPKSSAKLIVDYRIYESSGEVLSVFNNFTVEERLPRNESDNGRSYSAVIRRSINRFIFRAFYKPKGERR